MIKLKIEKTIYVKGIVFVADFPIILLQNIKKLQA